MILQDQGNMFVVYADQGYISLGWGRGNYIIILWWQELGLEGVAPTVVYTTLQQINFEQNFYKKKHKNNCQHKFANKLIAKNYL